MSGLTKTEVYHIISTGIKRMGTWIPLKVQINTHGQGLWNLDLVLKEEIYESYRSLLYSTPLLLQVVELLPKVLCISLHFFNRG